MYTIHRHFSVAWYFIDTAPDIQDLPTSRSVAENLTVGTSVYTVTASDTDDNDVASLDVQMAYNTFFEFDNATGKSVFCFVNANDRQYEYPINYAWWAKQIDYIIYIYLAIKTILFTFHCNMLLVNIITSSLTVFTTIYVGTLQSLFSLILNFHLFIYHVFYIYIYIYIHTQNVVKK